MEEKRIVNIRYTCCGLLFDAAIDCDFALHYYGFSPNDKEAITPIELYCLDRTDWDIKMIYQDNTNQHNDVYNHTFVEWENIMLETRSWVEEMTSKSKEV